MKNLTRNEFLQRYKIEEIITYIAVCTCTWQCTILHINCQCVLKNNNSRPKNEKGAGGGWGVPMTRYKIYLPWIPPFKVVQIRLLPCTIKTIRESTLGINHNALLLYVR